MKHFWESGNWKNWYLFLWIQTRSTSETYKGILGMETQQFAKLVRKENIENQRVKALIQV